MNAVLEQINSAGLRFVEFAWPMLVQSSVLIAILLLADLLLRRKVRAVFRYWLWMLVLAKLVLPSSLSSPVSVGSWFGDELASVKVSDSVAVFKPADAPEKQTHVAIELSSEVPLVVPARDVMPMVPEVSAQPAASTAVVTWQGVVFLAWVAAVAVMLLLLLQRAMFVIGLVGQAKEANNLMNDALNYCRRQMGMKGKVGLKVSANATSPAVCGLWRPVILVPENLGPNLGANGLRTVLLHELAHIKRADLWVNLAQTILQIIYFYNPLLWLANAVIRRVREQAVDEAVQVAMGANAQSYPETLVNVAKLAFKRPALSLRLIGVVESKSALKGRIKRMLNRPIPKSAKLGIVGLLTILITAAVLLPMASGKAKAVGFWHTSETAKDYKVTLRNGSTMELIAINMYPSHNKQWWRADGELLDYNIITSDRSNYPSDDPGYEFVLKKAGDCSFRIHKIRGSNLSSGLTVVEPEGLLACRVHINKKYKKTTLEIAVESGQWNTILETDGTCSTGTTDKRKRIVIAHKQKAGNATTISSSDDLNYKEASRIIAIDADGKEHTGSAITDTSINRLRHRVIKFDGILPKNIKMFKFQTCPYDYYKFKNVSLKPNFKTAVQVEGVREISEADKMASENLAIEGWTLWRQRKLAEAEKMFKRAVEKDPANANAWNGLGWSQQNQGKPLNAKASFEKCLKIQPKHAAALNGLGWIAKAQGKTDEAIGYWEKAIEAAPAATAALNGLATTYMELKQYDKAMKYYEMWLKVEPDNADAKAGLEKAKAHQKDVSPASKEAVDAALVWLKLIDDGDYGQSWEEAATLFRGAVSKADWERTMEHHKKGFGKIISRKVKSKKYTREVPGGPDGEYVIIQFESSFEYKRKAIETVTPMKDKDGLWRVSGYYIK